MKPASLALKPNGLVSTCNWRADLIGHSNTRVTFLYVAVDHRKASAVLATLSDMLM